MISKSPGFGGGMSWRRLIGACGGLGEGFQREIEIGVFGCKRESWEMGS